MLSLDWGRCELDENAGNLTKMLGDAMTDIGAVVEISIDDLQIETGDVWELVNLDGLGCDDAAHEDGYNTHLVAIERILEHAAVANLRFKLDKCVFFHPA